jgi:hypothetical protein
MGSLALCLVQILSAATVTNASPLRPQPCSLCCYPTPGINLAWNNCLGVGNAAENVSYACDGSRDGQPFRIVFSFVAPFTMDHFVGFQAILDITAGTAKLPDWWGLLDNTSTTGPGSCRSGNFTYPVPFTGLGDATCLNPWTGTTTGGGWAYYFENYGDYPPNPSLRPGWGRVKFAFARDLDTHLDAGQHYIAGVIYLDNLRDIDPGDGSGSCAGCSVGANLVMPQFEIYQTQGSSPYDIYVLCAAGTRSSITWQGGVVPVHSRTWGSIKATYR